MRRPYSVEQLTSAEKYFANLELGDIPQIPAGNKRDLFVLNSMTNIFTYCSKELIKTGLEKVNNILNKKRLAHIPPFLPEVLPHHPLVEIAKTRDTPNYMCKRKLLAEKHLGLPLQVIAAYNLLYLR